MTARPETINDTFARAEATLQRVAEWTAETDRCLRHSNEMLQHSREVLGHQPSPTSRTSSPLAHDQPSASSAE
jgi:hypothetical protein